MALGDGSFVRAGLHALVEFLRIFASPTGARGSVVLMTGGLVVLGFLFLAFTFRSAIVGDLAPASNARLPPRRARLPGESSFAVRPAAMGRLESFLSARQRGRVAATPTLDGVFQALQQSGVDARILQNTATSKRVRLYRCPSCVAGATVCEPERGLLAGSFERLTGAMAKVSEVSCARRGDAFCEFEIRHHAMIRRVKR